MSDTERMLKSEPERRLEFFTGAGRRRSWSTEQKAQIIAESVAAGASISAAAPRHGLCLFLDNGRLEIDNNVVERSIRPMALTRMNALLAGSDGRAEHWAVIASLIETCKLIGVEPYYYLADAIARIIERHLNELLPWAYPAAPQLTAVA